MAKILYVDDDKHMLEIFEALFAERFDVVTCGSAASALEILRSEAVGVLLADQEMPEMNGIELALKVRELNPGVVRILTTGGNGDSGGEAVNNGLVRTCIRKPWEQDELTQSLEQALECHELHMRASELEARMVANERLYALGLATAGIIHEIRNPLTSLAGNVDVRATELERVLAHLERGETDAAAKIVRGLCAYVQEDVESIAMLTDVCKGVEQSGASADRREYTDLVEVVRTLLQGAQGNLRGNSSLKVDLDKDVPRIRGSRSKLAQIFLNLFVNALQSQPDEEVGVTVSVSVKRKGDQVFLIVEDTGIGIPGGALSEIFKPFFTTKEEGGTGLGLAITRKLVEEMHGSIEVESVPGQGARFTVGFPA
jgi:signal transduction histidine kinase